MDYLLFFVIGGITSFFDLLTAPIVTLSIPLAIYILLTKNITFKKFAYICIAWSVGYALLWASKWGVAMLLTTGDIVSSVQEQISLRTSATYQGMEMTLPNIWKFVFDNLRNMDLMLYFWLSILVLVFMFAIYIKYFSGKQAFKQYYPFLIIFLMFPVWFFVLRNHSIQHGWFTWRAIAGMVFSILIFIDNTVNWSKILKK